MTMAVTIATVTMTIAAILTPFGTGNPPCALMSVYSTCIAGKGKFLQVSDDCSGLS